MKPNSLTLAGIFWVSVVAMGLSMFFRAVPSDSLSCTLFIFFFLDCGNGLSGRFVGKTKMNNIDGLTLEEKEMLIDELGYIRKCKADKIEHDKFINSLPPITDESVKELNAAIRGEPILKETDQFWKPRKMSLFKAFLRRIFRFML